MHSLIVTTCVKLHSKHSLQRVSIVVSDSYSDEKIIIQSIASHCSSSAALIEAYVVGNCQDSTKYRIDACWELLLWVTKDNKSIHPKSSSEKERMSDILDVI